MIYSRNQVEILSCILYAWRSIGQGLITLNSLPIHWRDKTQDTPITIPLKSNLRPQSSKGIQKRRRWLESKSLRIRAYSKFHVRYYIHWLFHELRLTSRLSFFHSFFLYFRCVEFPTFHLTLQPTRSSKIAYKRSFMLLSMFLGLIHHSTFIRR